MHHRAALVILAGLAREIELAAGSASDKSACRAALCCFHKCKPGRDRGRHVSSLCKTALSDSG
jgi:hypothetical protein